MNGSGKRVVVVTGGSGGLGREIVSRFAYGGDIVFLGYYRGHDRATAIATEIEAKGGVAHPLQIDLSSPASVEEAFRRVATVAGTVDVLINNAAYRPIGRFLDLTEDDWTAVLGANLLGAVRCCRNVLPGMVEQGAGRILNISGLDALWGWGNRAHVTVSKAGLAGLTRAVAVEFADSGITANTLVLGTFEVERDPTIYPRWERTRDYLIERTPLGRQGKPSDLAEWCWFLSSDASSWVTGQDIHLNGGAYPLARNPSLKSEC